MNKPEEKKNDKLQRLLEEHPELEDGLRSLEKALKTIEPYTAKKKSGEKPKPDRWIAHS